MLSQSSSVQSLNRVQLFATPWTAAHQASLSFIISQSLLRFRSIESVVQPSHPLLSPSPPAFNLSSIRVFSNESVISIRWPKYWSLSLNFSPSKEYSGLISFGIDWLDLLTVQRTFKNLQYHSSKASILRGSAFFIVQLLHPYITTGKAIALE